MDRVPVAVCAESVPFSAGGCHSSVDINHQPFFCVCVCVCVWGGVGSCFTWGWDIPKFGKTTVKHSHCFATDYWIKSKLFMLDSLTICDQFRDKQTHRNFPHFG